MAVTSRLTEIEIAGSTVVLPPGGITAIVGPNNVGKSLALRELDWSLVGWPGGQSPKLITRIRAESTGAPDEFSQWIIETSQIDRRNPAYPVYWRYGAQLGGGGWAWPADPPFGPLSRMLVQTINPGGASGIALQANSYDLLNEPPTQPLQYLYANADLEHELSDLVNAAFGFGVVVNRYGGSQITLHIGDAPGVLSTDGPPPPAYVDAMRGLPLMRDQGDGVKSFVGLLLTVIAAPFFYILIDEPDLYLHPPQAELIGRLLGQLKRAESQLFLATHSPDLLRGLLSASVPLTILRLDRRHGISTAAPLDSQSIQELWADPLLRYSNVLQAVFHGGAVLCEGDSDCRFYSSVLDEVAAKTDTVPDLLFTHCGGKQRLRVAVGALSAVRVPVAVIADFDVLQDESTLRPLVEALGGAWSALEPRWKTVKASVETMANNPTTAFVQQSLTDYVKAIKTSRLEARDEEAMRQIIKTDSGWLVAKRSGVAGLPGGAASADAHQLLRELMAIGLFVVPVGELERFVPEIGNHGSLWISEVHAKSLHKQAAAGTAGDFVNEVWRFLLG